MYKLTKLKNGLRIITHSMPHVRSVTSSVFVKAGSRYETDKQAGLSHFLEHMFFKGTKDHPTPADIYRRIENLGGHFNASTSKEFTQFYSILPRQHYKEGISFLTDIINNSLFQEEEIEKEKGVIIQEINMHLDNPAWQVYDLADELIWPQHELGRPVIGSKHNVASFQRQDFIEYLNQFYQPQNIVFSVAGNIKHETIVKEIKKYFIHKMNSKPVKYHRVKTKQTASRVLVKHKQTDQAHLCMVFKALEYDHRDEEVLNVLNTILGCGLGSRLSLNIRGDKGLAYAIHSFNDKFQDTGLFEISAGLDAGNLEKAVIEILVELNRLKKEPVAQREMSRAKKYLTGRLDLQMENTDDMADWYGHQLLFYPNIVTPQKEVKSLKKVSAADIQRLAKKIFNPDNLNLAVIGPLGKKNENNIRKIINQTF